MTIEKVYFSTYELAKAEKTNRLGVWRALHNDFDGTGIRVTFVNGPHDPENSDKSKESTNTYKRIKELNEKFINNSDDFTFDDYKEERSLSMK